MSATTQPDAEHVATESEDDDPERGIGAPLDDYLTELHLATLDVAAIVKEADDGLATR